MIKKKISIAVIGMGYVGLPLANELSKKFETKGYDINKKKIRELNLAIDRTEQIKKLSKKLFLTSNLNDLKNSNIFILCLPTPVNLKKKPDLKILKSSLKNIQSLYNKGDTIILESTFYPGATEELLSKYFEYKKNIINIGYSPERINPGDKKNTIKKITKVISANNLKTLNLMEKIYGSINNNNIYKAKSIRVAEAAKLIENVQRDLNIGLMNELTKIFDKIKISIHDVLDAANTKWNFLNFTPGLVGGHCIGVDPYYLKSLCEKIKFNPKIFMSARNTNENMILFYKKKILKYLNKSERILFLGITFKEDTNDLRNSKNLELLYELSKDRRIYYLDPFVDNLKNTNKNIVKYKKQLYDTIILAVPHKKLFKFIKNNLKSILKIKGNFIDLNRKYKSIDKSKFKYVNL